MISTILAKNKKYLLPVLTLIASAALPQTSWPAQINRNNLIGSWSCKSITMGQGEMKSINSSSFVRIKRDGSYSRYGTTTVNLVIYDIPVEWIFVVKDEGRWSLTGDRFISRGSFVDIEDRWRVPYYLDISELRKYQLSQEMKNLGIYREIKDSVLDADEYQIIMPSNDRVIIENGGVTTTCDR